MCSGHNAQGGEPGEVSSPSHHALALMAIWCSHWGLGLDPGLEMGQQRAMQSHVEETPTGDEPRQQHSSLREES